MKRRFALAIAAGLIAIGSGCSTVRYLPQPLPLPARPTLPRLTASDVACLSDDAYARLATRDRLRRQYGERLEAIIGATRR